MTNKILPSSSKSTMNCCLIAAHGEDIDKLITIGEKPKPIRSKGELLLKVHACALAPGDIRVMKGHCDFFQSPGKFPYTPGGDVCGVVEEADALSRFRKGDAVVAMFEIPRPLRYVQFFVGGSQKSLHSTVLIEFSLLADWPNTLLSKNPWLKSNHPRYRGWMPRV